MKQSRSLPILPRPSAVVPVTSGVALSTVAGVAVVELAPHAHGTQALVVSAAAAVLVLLTRFVTKTEHADAMRRLGIGAFVLVVLTTCWNGVKVHVGGSAVAPYDLMLLVAFGFAVLAAAMAQSLSLIPRWLFGSAAIFAVAAAIAAIFPPSPTYTASSVLLVDRYLPAGTIDPRSGLGNFARLEIAVFLLPATAVLLLRGSRHMTRRMADVFALSALVSATVAVLDGFAHTGISQALVGVPQAAGRQAGLMNRPNDLALASALALPVTLLWFSGDRRSRILGLIGSAILLAGVYVSGSRGGFIIVPIIVLLTAYGVPRLRRVIRRLLVPLVAAAIIAMPVVGHHLLTKVEAQGRLTAMSQTAASSDSERLALLKQGFRDIGAKPIAGVGLSSINDAHDIYVEVLASTGLIGGLAFVLLIGGVFGRFSTAASIERSLAVVLGAQIVAWLIIGTVENEIISSYTYVPPALLIGLAATKPRRWMGLA